MSQREVVFVDGSRTPFGRLGGGLKDIIAGELGIIVIKDLLEKTKINEKTNVDNVFIGSASGCKSNNPARYATIGALGYDVPCSFIEFQCGSAIDAINHAAWKIIAGEADVIIAGGVESYSQMTVKFPMHYPPYRMTPPMPLPPLLSPIEGDSIGMGLTAEVLQVQYDIPREASDEFAFNSQMRAKVAMESGILDQDIVPVITPATKRTPEVVFDKDEHPRPGTTLEALSKLSPVFKKGGTVTAGSSSGQNDGAGAILMMSAEKAKELGYEPIARWISGGEAGCDPKAMGIGPAYAIPVALKRAGLKLSDMDVMECNEAFAVQNLAVIKEVENLTGEKVDMEKWNPLGGAIAFGHPNGASGIRLSLFTMRQLIETGGKYGFFSSCAGGGLGVVTVIENLKR